MRKLIESHKSKAVKRYSENLNVLEEETNLAQYMMQKDLKSFRLKPSLSTSLLPEGELFQITPLQNFNLFPIVIFGNSLFVGILLLT